MPQFRVERVTCLIPRISFLLHRSQYYQIKYNDTGQDYWKCLIFWLCYKWLLLLKWSLLLLQHKTILHYTGSKVYGYGRFIERYKSGGTIYGREAKLWPQNLMTSLVHNTLLLLNKELLEKYNYWHYKPNVYILQSDVLYLYQWKIIFD